MRLSDERIIAIVNDSDQEKAAEQLATVEVSKEKFERIARRLSGRYHLDEAALDKLLWSSHRGAHKLPLPGPPERS
jgi:hypothetical protein